MSSLGALRNGGGGGTASPHSIGIYRLLPAIITIATALIVWWLASTTAVLSVDVFPSPSSVYHRLAEISEDGGLLTDSGRAYGRSVWGHALVSVGRLFIGLSAGWAIGGAVGLLMGISRLTDAVFQPLVELLRPIPPIAWTPLAIVWFGVGLQAIVFIIALGAFWPMVVNTSQAVRSATHEGRIQIRAARSLGASPVQVLMRVVIPASWPRTMVGMRVSLNVAWWMIVPAEIIAGRAGLGFFVMRARTFGDLPAMVGGILVVGAVGSVLFGLSNRVFPERDEN